MNRDMLIQQVKGEYARLAELASSEHMANQSYGGGPPEAYYERALENAIGSISAGQYDDCTSGLEVVEQIANHKSKAQRMQDTIVSTLHNMEISEELSATESDSKKRLRLDAENERRAETLPHMIRSWKEEQAQELLDTGSPGVIGGGGNG